MTGRETEERPGCRRAEDVPALLLGELTGAARESMSAHLSACPECSRVAAEVESTLRILREAPGAEEGRDLTPEIMARLPAAPWPDVSTGRTIRLWRSPAWLRAAAAVAVLAGGLVLLALLRPGRGPAAGERAGRPAPEAVVAATVSPALEWLARTQEADGRWSGGRTEYDVGVSALALLALVDPHVQGIGGGRSEAIRRGAGYLVGQQDASGLIGPRFSAATYNHGLATLALIEVCAVESNAAWEAGLDKALRFIRSTQTRRGGWGYLDAQGGAPNTAATVWPLQALIRGEAKGRGGLRPDIERGLAWMLSTINGDGLMGYTAAGDFPYDPAGMTAAGAVCLLMEEGGWRRRELQAMRRILCSAADDAGASFDLYRSYFRTRAVILGNCREAAARQAADRARIAGLQKDSGADAGCWDVKDAWTDVGGRVYATAIATLTMQCR